MSVSGAVASGKTKEFILKEVALQYDRILNSVKAISTLTVIERENIQKRLSAMQIDCPQLRNTSELNAFWIDLNDALKLYIDILRRGGITQRSQLLNQLIMFGKRLRSRTIEIALTSEAVQIYNFS